MSEMIRKELIQRLADFDEEVSLLFGDGERFQMVIVGGGALILMNLIPRATHDIDVLNTSFSVLGELMEQYDMNGRVGAFADYFPYNYEDRLEPVAGITGKRIDFFTASLEDIVIAKLYSVRDKDIEDITSPKVLAALDWDTLYRLATSEDEAMRSAVNDRRYSEFLRAFEDYERRFRPCGD